MLVLGIWTLHEDRGLGVIVWWSSSCRGSRAQRDTIEETGCQPLRLWHEVGPNPSQLLMAPPHCPTQCGREQEGGAGHRSMWVGFVSPRSRPKELQGLRTILMSGGLGECSCVTRIPGGGEGGAWRQGTEPVSTSPPHRGRKCPLSHGEEAHVICVPHPEGTEPLSRHRSQAGRT